MSELKHAAAFPCTEVEHRLAALPAHVIYSCDMASCKIHNMDVVTHAGAVRRVVIAAEYIEMVPAADCNL